MDGEGKQTSKKKKKKNLTDHFFFFTATPRGDGRGQCAVTLRAGKSGCCPSERDPAAFFLLRTASRPSAIGALVTMLGGSLVSLHRGRFWGSLSSTEEEESTTGLRDASPRDREREREREKTSTRHNPEEPRADRVVSYCKVELFPAAATVSEAVHTPLRSLWMRGRLVSAPLRTAHSCAGSAPVLSAPKQPAKNELSRNHADRTESFLSFFCLSFSSTGHFLIIHRSHACKLPPTRA